MLPEEEWATAIDNMHKKFPEHQTCSSEDIIAGRQTHTQRQKDTLITILHSLIGGGVKTTVKSSSQRQAKPAEDVFAWIHA